MYYFVNINLPPNLSIQEFSTYLSTFKDIPILNNYPIFVFGDFNVPNYVRYIDDHKSDSRCISLENFAQFLNRLQYNFVYNKNDRVLDLIYSNISVMTIRALCPLVTEDSHHPAIAAEILLTSTHKYISSSFNKVEPQLNTVFNFRKAKFDLLYATLFSVEWNFLNDFDDVRLF